MLRDTFPALLELQPAPSLPLRFGKVVHLRLMLLPTHPKEITASPARPMNCLQKWSSSGFPRQLTDIVTVTDVRMGQILRRAGWPLRRIGNPARIGNTLAVAGYLAISG